MLAFYAATALLVVCLTFIVLRPYGLPEALPPVLAAAIAIATGLEPMGAIPGLWGLVWDATLTFLGLMLISLVMDRCGFFPCARTASRT